MSAKDTLVPMGTVGDAVATEDPKTEAVDKPVAPTTATKDSFTPASTKDEAVDKSIVPKTTKEDPVASTSTEVYVANTSVTPATVTEDSLEAPENVVVPEIDVDQAEGDDYNGDADSTLGTNEYGSSTTSVNTSIRAYRTENGRTYHSFKDGQYLIPNDEEEKNRLDLLHHLFTIALNNALVSFAIPKGKTFHRVLDIGTGTGIWAIDFADEHPESEVLGVDLSPIQPEFLPPNCCFEIDDLEENWVFTHKFDLIHSRMMVGSIANFPRLFKQAFDNLNPGGFIQLTDICFPVQSDDGTVTPDSWHTQWTNHMMEAGEKIGRPLNATQQYKTQLEAAGFVDVVVEVQKWPINQWSKDKKAKQIGMWNHENSMMAYPAISLALFTRVLGWSSLELEVLLAHVKSEIRDTKIHAYYNHYFIHGRKP